MTISIAAYNDSLRLCCTHPIKKSSTYYFLSKAGTSSYRELWTIPAGKSTPRALVKQYPSPTVSVHAQSPPLTLGYGPGSKDYIFRIVAQLYDDFQTQTGIKKMVYTFEKSTGTLYCTRVYNCDYPDDPGTYFRVYPLVSVYLRHSYTSEQL